MRILNFLYEPHALFIQTIESDQDLGQLMEPDPLSFSFNTIGWKESRARPATVEAVS